MKFNKLHVMFAMLAFSAVTFSEVSYVKAEEEEIEIYENEIVAFHPVDCGIQAQEIYEYPFMGLTFELSEEMLAKIDSREVFVFTQEDYTENGEISYAFLRFSAPTKQQQEEEGMSVDILSWEENLEKIGVIGVYEKDVTEKLDELTLCNTHEKIGESSDGAYAYYISINSTGNQKFAEELESTNVEIGEMHALDFEMGYSAFSMDRIEDLESVGSFSMEDIFGNVYTESMFENYDLTLVNVFATWCSPCVQEMPELEKLRQEYEEEGIKFGVAAIVLDAKTTGGLDEGALERAKVLYEKCEAQFPFLIPDESNMNGRLTGIESIPESFFVDSEGNIVSEPYIGANSLENWKKIVDTEMANIGGENE